MKMQFKDLTVGAMFRMDHPERDVARQDPHFAREVYRKVRPTGYVAAENNGIHGDCDADYPVETPDYVCECCSVAIFSGEEFFDMGKGNGIYCADCYLNVTEDPDAKVPSTRR